MAAKNNDCVIRLFQVIDRREWDQLPVFFHHDVIYERPGYREVHGIDDLMRFYREERRIESGCHELEYVVVNANQAVAIGTFRGELHDGRCSHEMFADAYKFKEGRIWHRRTYFFRPAI